MANLSPLSSLSEPISGAEGRFTPIALAIIAPLNISSGTLLVLSTVSSWFFLLLGLSGVYGYPSLYTYCSKGGGGTSVIRESLEPPTSLWVTCDVTPIFPGCSWKTLFLCLLLNVTPSFRLKLHCDLLTTGWESKVWGMHGKQCGSTDESNGVGRFFSIQNEMRSRDTHSRLKRQRNLLFDSESWEISLKYITR